MKKDLKNKDAHLGEVAQLVSRLGSLLNSDILDVQDPSDSDIDLIERLCSGDVEVSPETIGVVVINVCDNLINRGNGKWELDSLQRMSTMLPDKPATLDHSYYENNKVWGRIFDSQYNLVDPETVKANWSDFESLCDKAGCKSVNEEIALTEGYATVEAKVYTLKAKPIYSDIAYGIKSEVSLGGFRVTDYKCPLCNTSFRDSSCPHYIPDYAPPVDVRKEIIKANPVAKSYFEDYAPYFIRSGIFDLMELSFVTTPAYPNAKIKQV